MTDPEDPKAGLLDLQTGTEMPLADCAFMIPTCKKMQYIPDVNEKPAQ